MNADFLLFLRLIVRPLLKEPVRTGLTVFAVALGVAVVVAIDLAGNAATGSFHSSLASLAGKTDLEITGTGGIDEKLLGKLVQLPYAFEFAPRIEDFASIEGKGSAIPFFGVDLIAQGSQAARANPEVQTISAEPQDEYSIWVGRQLGLPVGQHVRLLINDAFRRFTVAGILPERSGAIDTGRILVADIAIAQAVTQKIGKLDSITVKLPPGKSIDYWQDVLQKQLPASVAVEPRGTRTEENRKMLAAFRWNLRVLSYIALVVGAFLIYNTISVSVVRRRAEIGIVRSLGATRGRVAAAFLAESLFFAITGSLVGLVIGRVMAIGAVRLIGNTVQSLYVSSQPGAIELTAAGALSGLTLGMLVSTVAGLGPAWEASRVAPVEAMARGREEYVAAVRSHRFAPWAILLLVTAAALTRLPPVHRQPVFAYIAVGFLIAGTSALIPNLVIFVARTAGRALLQWMDVEALLALRSLRASLGRTSVLTAALATAVAMTASVGIMVGSFRETVSVWMDNQLKADFYLRPAGSAGADRHPTMSPAVADDIERLPGVAAVDRFRAYPISYEGVPATLAGGETSRIRQSEATRFLPGENRKQILSKLPAGDYAVVSEPFASKHNVQVGSILHVPLGNTTRNFEVLGIYYDYSTERGFIVLDRGTLLKYLPDPAASNLAVYLKPGANPEAVRPSIDQAIGGRAVMVFANGSLRSAAIAIFDRTFRITYALEAVAVIVAVMGIAGALLALVIDRRREYSLIRFLGASRHQVRRLILCEAGLLGLLSNLVGLLLGTALSLILIFVINKQSFGWTIQFHWPVVMLLSVLTGVYAATIAAALYPARTALSFNPIEVIHEQ